MDIDFWFGGKLEIRDKETKRANEGRDVHRSFVATRKPQTTQKGCLRVHKGIQKRLCNSYYGLVLVLGL